MSFIIYLFVSKVTKLSINCKFFVKGGVFVMIFKLFRLENLLSVCIKIINSVIVVGLYYGFLTTFSIGPSYLFLLRTRVMEEGTEKEISATTGFIMGQFIMFVSIYYAPLYSTLNRPHTITILVIPYLFFHFFWNNHKNFFNYGFTNNNSMRNLSIQCVFLNNLIFQLFNHFILPSSTLARLVNIYMFRCNNKMLFITSSFVGWLIGHILLRKWVVLVLFWIRQNHSIQYKKHFVSEFRNYMVRIVSILLFITCVYYLGRMPSPIITKKLKETPETKEGVKSEEENDVEITYETKEIKQEQGKIIEKPLSYLDKMNGKQKSFLGFEEPLVTFLFDYKRWNRPLRYIKNDKFENAVQKKMSQYFFFLYPNNGKQKISFTYLPSLEIFSKMIERNFFSCTTKKLSNEELYNYWVYINEQKRCSLINELISRLKTFEKQKECFVIDALQKKNRLCNDDDNQQKYLPQLYDPFLNGPYRGTIKKFSSQSIMSNLVISIENNKNYIERVWINKIYDLLYKNYKTFIELKNQKDKDIEFIFSFIGNSLTPIEEIKKKVPRWSYKLTDDFEKEEEEEEEEEKNEKKMLEDTEIRSRKAKRVVIYTDNDQYTDTSTKINSTDSGEEIALIRYSQQPDFRREIIKGSMRAQRRKTVICEIFQANVQSPFFLDRKDKTYSFDIFEMGNLIFKKWVVKEPKLNIYDCEEEDTKENKKKKEEKKNENERIIISENWDTIIFAQAIRGLLLVTQSFLRKYIVLPSLIIAKNIGRMLLFQLPEWYEDLKDWNKEMHVKCTYNGVQLSEKEFPKDWLTDGIQIKILFPFCLKPWRKFKNDFYMDTLNKKENFCFLTICGMETELPFGSPRKTPSFFDPIYEELLEKIEKLKNKIKKIYFLIFQFFQERTRWFMKVIEEKIRCIVLFIKRILEEFKKVNPILLFILGKTKINELNEKDSKISNKIDSTLPISIGFTTYTKLLLLEKKKKSFSDRTIIMRNQIEQVIKDKKKIIMISGDKNLELQKGILQIFKRKNIRLIHKSNYFIKSFIEKIYINFLLHTINISKSNIQPFYKSLKKIIKKYIIYNDKINQQRIDKTNENKMNFIFTLKKSTNTTSDYNLSFLSQAYVFYKISQTKLFNSYSLKSILKYNDTYPFFNEKIQDYCIVQRIFDIKSKNKKIQKSGINEWKNWLKHCYQSNLSQIKWSQLALQKWRNKVNQKYSIKKKPIKLDSHKLASDKKERDQFIYYKGKNYSEVDSLVNKKKKFNKQYEYDFLLHEYMNYRDKKNLYIYVPRLQINEEQEISYNFNILKKKFLYILVNKVIYDYLHKEYIINKNLDRKYFNSISLNFFILQNIDINTWINVHLGTNIKNNTNIKENENNDYQKNIFFNWMEINQEKLYRSISNLELWFFSEFTLFFNGYKINSQIIPIKLLLFDFYENISQYKNINIDVDKKNSFSKLSNQKEYLELEKLKKNEQQSQGNLQFDSKKEKSIEKDYIRSEIKKRQPKNKKNTELDVLLKQFLFFQLILHYPFNERIISNIKVYCLLLRLVNLKEITISSIERGEMRLDIMMIKKKKNTLLTELIKKRILIIEPTPISRRKDGKFIIYQTIAVSLIEKSKHQTNKKYIKTRYVVSKNSLDRFIAQYTDILVNGNKTYYAFFIPENILSSRCRKELRILICFNSHNLNVINKNLVFSNKNKIKKNVHFLNKHLNILNIKTDINKIVKLKSFLWPNFRLEDLACMNRYWFDTNNGSRLSIGHIYMYSQFIIL
uniref:Protein TIC 214 n=1 Tax=Campylosiphon championii TaxID=1861789 RepID=A0A2H4EC50_9LILI|nr:hypothetical chloroplast RF1 [Burmannia championii]ANK36300.1 hypothetical chloroplast RF1 [Burmannia championii]